MIAIRILSEHRIIVPIESVDDHPLGFSVEFPAGLVTYVDAFIVEEAWRRVPVVFERGCLVEETS